MAVVLWIYLARTACTAATKSFSYLLMREKEKGDQLLVSSLQKALNYVLMLARAASQNTDGLVFEQTNAVTFPCACYILKTTVLNNHMRPAESSS